MPFPFYLNSTRFLHYPFSQTLSKITKEKENKINGSLRSSSSFDPRLGLEIKFGLWLSRFKKLGFAIKLGASTFIQFGLRLLRFCYGEFSKLTIIFMQVFEFVWSELLGCMLCFWGDLVIFGSANLILKLICSDLWLHVGFLC